VEVWFQSQPDAVIVTPGPGFNPGGTDERVVRIDRDIPPKLSKIMVPDKLFHKISL
jgi:hypothetical protein